MKNPTNRLLIKGLEIDYTRAEYPSEDTTVFKFRGEHKRKWDEYGRDNLNRALLQYLDGSFDLSHWDEVGREWRADKLEAYIESQKDIILLGLKHTPWQEVGEPTEEKINFIEAYQKQILEAFPTVEWEDPYPRVREAWIENVPKNELPKTFTARFRLQDGTELKIPEPRSGWEMIEEEIFDWPCAYVLSVDLDDETCAWIEIDLEGGDLSIIHLTGLCWIHDFAQMLEEKEARILWIRRWEQQKPILVNVEPEPTVQITDQDKAQVASTWPRTGKPRKVI